MADPWTAARGDQLTAQHRLDVLAHPRPFDVGPFGQLAQPVAPEVHGQAGEPVAQRCRHWLPDPRVEARGVCEQHDGRCVARRPAEIVDRELDAASRWDTQHGRSVVVHGLTLSDDCWGATTKTFSWERDPCANNEP